MTIFVLCLVAVTVATVAVVLVARRKRSLASGVVSVKGGNSTQKRNRMIFYVVMFALPVLNFLVFYVYINFQSFALAFQRFDFGQGYVFFGFGNFKQIFSDLKTELWMQSAITNSLGLFFWTLIFGAFLSVLFSYYIFKKHFGSEVFKVILYLPHIISSVVFVIMYKYFLDVAIPSIFKTLWDKEVEGLIANTESTHLWVLVFSIWVSFGTQVLMYTGAMSSISVSVIESASLDGVKPLQELIFIVIPSIWATFVTFMVVCTVGIFTDQMALFSFFGVNAEHKLYTIGYYLYAQAYNGGNVDYPYLSAVGLLLTAIAIPLTLTCRYLLNKFGPKTY